MPYCRSCGNQLQEADNFCETCGTARRGVPSKKTYIGKTCPYCQYPIKDEFNMVACSKCSIPHHKECWEKNGGCTTYGCRETSCRPAIIHKLEVSFDELHDHEVAGLESLSGSEVGNAGQQKSGRKIYKLTYQTGELSLIDLPVGAWVVDPSWIWDFRTDNNYKGTGLKKSLVWIVVAKNHYDISEPHVTLLAEELIGKHPFDNNSTGSIQYGSNNWGDSGGANPTRGLRPWLNSAGIHAEGFCRDFTDSFGIAVLATPVPNRDWENGSVYITMDCVFIPSTTELGDSAHIRTYTIGSVYQYFSGANNAKRVALLDGNARWYWTRSPASDLSSRVRSVHSSGEFCNSYAYDRVPDYVRPALNLRAGIMVSASSDFIS